MKPPKIWLFCLLFLLYILHTDFWNWRDNSLVLGLPIGLLYHIGFCLATVAVLSSLVRWAWPIEDEES